MKHLTKILFSVLAIASLLQMPAAAQSRGGSGRSSSSSSSSSSSRSSGSSSSSRGSSSGSYSSGSSSRSSSSSYSSSSSRQSYSSPARQSSSQTRQSYSTQRQGSQTQRQGAQASQSSRQSYQSGSQRQSSQTARQSSAQTRRQGSQAQRQGLSASSLQSGPQVQRQPGRTGIQTQRSRPQTYRIPPRDRRPMRYDRPYRFWHAGHHCYGYRVTYIPSWYVRRVYGGYTYYIVDDVYYRYYGGYYYVCRPPMGIVVNSFVGDVVLAACTFAYYNSINNTFNTINENARIITEQNATIAANNALIAQQNSQLALHNDRAEKSYNLATEMGLVQSFASASQEYFYQDGVFYSKDSEGKYITIVPPAGALVDTLPEDYDVIEMEGVEYYKVDDTVFTTTVVDGKIYFEVLGQFTGELARKYDLNSR